MTESTCGTPEVGGESVPVVGVSGGDEVQPDLGLFAPASEGSDVGVEQ